MNTLVIAFVLLIGTMSLIRSQHMRKNISVDKDLPERKALAQLRLDKACEQTTILLKKVSHTK